MRRSRHKPAGLGAGHAAANEQPGHEISLLDMPIETLMQVAAWLPNPHALFRACKQTAIMAHEDTCLALWILNSKGNLNALNALPQLSAYIKLSQTNQQRLVHKLLEAGSIHLPSSPPTALLLHAAMHGNAAVLRTLLSRGAPIEHCFTDLLFHASSQGHTQAMSTILELGPVPPDPTAVALALYTSAQRNRLPAIQLLLHACSKDPAGCPGLGPCLFAASVHGHLAVVQLLLQHDAASEQQHLDMALQQAAAHGHLPVVELLLQSQADLHSEGDLPLALACQEGHMAVVACLMARGASVSAQGGRALRLAAESGRVEVVELLVGSGSVGHPQLEETLVGACAEGQAGVVGVLLARGADPAYSNCMAMERAARYGRTDCLRLLLSHAPLQHPARCLRQAVKQRHAAALALLLQHCGAQDLQAGDWARMVERAAGHGDAAVLKLLLEHLSRGSALSPMYGALQAACKGPAPAVVELLLQHCRYPDEQMQMVVMSAALHQHTSMLAALLPHTSSHVTACVLASISVMNSMAGLECLVSAGADVAQLAGPALVMAAQQGLLAMTRALLSHGAAVRSLDDEALVRAHASGHRQLEALLLEAGADPRVLKEGGRLRAARGAGRQLRCALRQQQRGRMQRLVMQF